jgi:hypothetical protein
MKTSTKPSIEINAKAYSDIITKAKARTEIMITKIYNQMDLANLKNDIGIELLKNMQDKCELLQNELNTDIPLDKSKLLENMKARCELLKKDHELDELIIGIPLEKSKLLKDAEISCKLLQDELLFVDNLSADTLPEAKSLETKSTIISSLPKVSSPSNFVTQQTNVFAKKKLSKIYHIGKTLVSKLLEAITPQDSDHLHNNCSIEYQKEIVAIKEEGALVY